MSLSIENDSDNSQLFQVNVVLVENNLSNDIDLKISKVFALEILKNSQNAEKEIKEDYDYIEDEKKYISKNTQKKPNYLPNTDCLYPNKTEYGACPCVDTKALCCLDKETVKIETPNFRFLKIPAPPIPGTLGGVLKYFEKYGGRFRFNLFYQPLGETPNAQNQPDFGYTKALLMDFLKERNEYQISIAKAIAKTNAESMKNSPKNNSTAPSSLHETIAKLMDKSNKFDFKNVGLALKSYCESWDPQGTPNFTIAAPCFHTRLLVTNVQNLCDACCNHVEGCNEEIFLENLTEYTLELKLRQNIPKMIDMDELAEEDFIKGAVEKRETNPQTPSSMFATVS